MIAQTPNQSRRPVVIGGGMAGIAAAVRLAGAGLQPLLIESRPYLGGRTRSFVHAGTGDEIDNGQHLMMGCYHDTLKLLDTLGTRHLAAFQPSLRVEFRNPDGSADFLIAPRHLPAPLNVLWGMLRLSGLSMAERLGLLRVGLGLRSGRASGGETVEQYLKRHRQSERVRRRLWDPIVIATLNTPPESASAELFVEVMRRAFLGRERSDSQLVFARKGLSELIAPAEAYISSCGGGVMKGSTVQSVAVSGEIFTIALNELASVTAGSVILAVPPRALVSLAERTPLLGAVAAPLRMVTASPIVSVYLWYDRDAGTLPEFAALLGTRTQWMFNRRKICPANNPRFPGLISCTVSAAFAEASADSATISGTADRELRSAFPRELGDARLLDWLVIREKHATFAATPQTELLRPPARTAVPGIYAAGDWTDTGLPGTIEGAVQSGFAAAESITRSLLGSTA